MVKLPLFPLYQTALIGEPGFKVMVFICTGKMPPASRPMSFCMHLSFPTKFPQENDHGSVLKHWSCLFVNSDAPHGHFPCFAHRLLPQSGSNRMIALAEALLCK